MTTIGSILLAWSWMALLLQLGSTPIWVPLTIILIIILIFWWGLTRNKIKDESSPQDEEEEDENDISAHTESVVAVDDNTEEIKEIEDATEVTEPSVPVEPDDLKLIEGIGPKISTVLADAGIVTFAQLAETDEKTLEKLVREDAGIRLARPATWPEQARLAAAGDWDELEQLQDRLHGGQHK